MRNAVYNSTKVEVLQYEIISDKSSSPFVWVFQFGIDINERPGSLIYQQFRNDLANGSTLGQAPILWHMLLVLLDNTDGVDKDDTNIRLTDEWVARDTTDSSEEENSAWLVKQIQSPTRDKNFVTLSGRYTKRYGKEWQKAVSENESYYGIWGFTSFVDAKNDMQFEVKRSVLESKLNLDMCQVVVSDDGYRSLALSNHGLRTLLHRINSLGPKIPKTVRLNIPILTVNFEAVHFNRPVAEGDASAPSELYDANPPLDQTALYEDAFASVVEHWTNLETTYVDCIGKGDKRWQFTLCENDQQKDAKDELFSRGETRQIYVSPLMLYFFIKCRVPETPDVTNESYSMHVKKMWEGIVNNYYFLNPNNRIVLADFSDPSTVKWQAMNSTMYNRKILEAMSPSHKTSDPGSGKNCILLEDCSFKEIQKRLPSGKSESGRAVRQPLLVWGTRAMWALKSIKQVQLKKATEELQASATVLKSVAPNNFSLHLDSPIELCWGYSFLNKDELKNFLDTVKLENVTYYNILNEK